MATHQISILGGNAIPDPSGRCWLEPYDVAATNDVWKHLVFRMKDPTGTLSNGVYGQFTVPQNYVGTAAVIPVWTTTATSGTATFRVTYRTVGGDDTTSLDQSSNEEQVTLNDIAPTAAHRRMTPSASLTSANLAAGETVEFFFERYYTPDSIAADLLLFDVIFQYADA